MRGSIWNMRRMVTDGLIADIEDMLTTVAFLRGKKWTSMLIKRTYFGNWLRDYSQAIDVGSLKGVNAPTIRILVGMKPSSIDCQL
jgi:hypothetical protein